MQMQYTVRGAGISDLHKIMVLHKDVAAYSGGIARQADEITESHVRNFIERSLEKGIILTIEDPDNSDALIAEVHTSTPGIRAFAHLLTDLTVVVHPDYQGKGIGTLLFRTLFEEIESKHPQILRIELIAKESNIKAINFYKKFGFKAEGRLDKRISGKSGELEADIPMAWIRLDNNSKL